MDLWEEYSDCIRYQGDIQVRLWPKGSKIQLKKRMLAYVPTEFHFLEDGAIGDKPSVAIVMERPDGQAVFGEISLEMLEPVLAQCAKMRSNR